MNFGKFVKAASQSNSRIEDLFLLFSIKLNLFCIVFLLVCSRSFLLFTLSTNFDIRRGLISRLGILGSAPSGSYSQSLDLISYINNGSVSCVDIRKDLERSLAEFHVGFTALYDDILTHCE
jgi:hypothetical protein